MLQPSLRSPTLPSKSKGRARVSLSSCLDRQEASARGIAAPIDTARPMPEKGRMQSAPQMAPIVAVTQQLSGDHVLRGPALAGRVERMACDAQMGPALHEGEVVLAGLNYEFPERGRAQGSHAPLLVTDRRIFGSLVAGNIQSTRVDVPLAQVTDVRDDRGLMNHAVVLVTPGREVRVPMYGKQLLAYLRGVLALPPAARILGPLAIVPSAGDPVGAQSATASLVSANPVTRALPLLVYEAGRRGMLHEGYARAVLERVVILDRSIFMGRGMHRG
jgi:hypothetical protein